MDVVFNFAQDRESQIRIALAFYPFWGEKAPPLCDVCGGIKDPAQARTRRCLCDEKHNQPLNNRQAQTDAPAS
jgi:hypothetical protein